MNNNHSIYTRFFDNNVFRKITSNGNGYLEFLRNYIKSLDDASLDNIFDGTITNRITSFTILEAIGLKIPKAEIELPTFLIASKDIAKINTYIYNEIKDYYSNNPAFNLNKILEFAEKQKKYTTTTGIELFESSVIKAINHEGFYERLIADISCDYFLKFDFTDEINSIIIYNFLIPSLFTKDSLHIRKTRIVKKIWDIIKVKFYKNTTLNLEEKKELDDAMKFKNQEDFVDCDLIHLVCFGDYRNGKYDPVVALTTDIEIEVINRIKVFKYVVQICGEIYDGNNDFKGFIINKNWREGKVIIFNTNGTLKRVIDVNTILPLNLT